ncbi:MAG: YbgA family protein [Desulfobacteraceae bacterium]
MEPKIKIGISACLLGEKVRFDGQHKLDRFITDTLGKYLEFAPVCPEVECGFGVPREPFRLIGDPAEPRMVTVRTKVDVTDRMLAWAQKRVQELADLDLCGFIFKSDSPSSGMERVKVYNDKGMPEKKGVGLFARQFMDHFPLLPVEEEGRLHDPKLRENFIERLFTLKRWREMAAVPPRRGQLVDFHTQHKLLLLSHSPQQYRLMGQLVAQGKDLPLAELFSRYLGLLMDTLRLKTTAKKNANVLEHIMGYFKRDLSKDEKAELLETIEHYHQGFIPLIVPITLVNHYVRKYQQLYLKGQYYLHPHPVELQLRNHV